MKAEIELLAKLLVESLDPEMDRLDTDREMVLWTMLLEQTARVTAVESTVKA